MGDLTLELRVVPSRNGTAATVALTTDGRARLAAEGPDAAEPHTKRLAQQLPTPPCGPPS
jgi:hypothetical protein